MDTRHGASLLWAALAGGCLPPNSAAEDEDSTEVISRVVLTFTPSSGGSAFAFEFDDPDGDGGVSGTADPVVLPPEQTFSLAVSFFVTLTGSTLEITDEIADEAEEHLLLILGEGVQGPASGSPTTVVTHAYDDLESDYGGNEVGADLPVGLRGTMVTGPGGAGTLRIQLRHLPPLNGNPQKTGDLVEASAAGESLPGDVDVDVSFDLTVQ